MTNQTEVTTDYYNRVPFGPNHPSSDAPRAASFLMPEVFLRLLIASDFSQLPLSIIC
jgi:hypothetical protein